MRERDRIIADAERELLNISRLIDQNISVAPGLREQLRVQEQILEGLQPQVSSIQQEISNLRGRIEQIQSEILLLPLNVSVPVCRWVTTFLPWPLSDLVEEICENVDQINPAVQQLRDQVLGVQAAIRQKEQELTAIGFTAAQSAVAQLRQSIEEADRIVREARPVQRALELQLEVYRRQRELEMNAVRESEQAFRRAERLVADARSALEALRADFEKAADAFGRIQLLSLFFDGWAADIRRAGTGFVEASQLVALNIMARNDNNNLGPYLDWWQCWAPVLVAIPSEVTLTSCTIRDEFNRLRGELTQFVEKLSDDLGVLGWVLLPTVKLQVEMDRRVLRPLQQRVKREIIDLSVRGISFLTNPQLGELVGLMAHGDRISDERLNGIYASDDSGSRLLAIPDISRRVVEDFGPPRTDGTIDHRHFSALRNSIVLAKIALLDGPELNRLVADAPISRARRPFPESSTSGFSLLLGAVRSIDGNEQWQRFGLPYPRSAGTDGSWPREREYGRGRAPLHSGFVLWGDPEIREAVFRRIFRGPLTPALLSHPDVAARYPFLACARNPFPSTTRADGTVAADGDPRCRLIADGESSGTVGTFGVLSVRPVRTRELRHLTSWELRVARNEIFARRGFQFEGGPLGPYFESEPWYTPLPGDAASRISSLEWENIARIQALERGLRLRRRPGQAN